MKIQLEKGEWGYYLDSEWLRHSIFEDTDVPNGPFVVLKSKNYVEDIEREVIQTNYYQVVRNDLKFYNKLEIADIMAGVMIKQILKSNQFPYNTSIKKQSKNITTLKFQPDKYDEFNIKIRKEHVGGKTPSDILNAVSPAPKLPIRGKTKGKEKVQDEVKMEYAVKGKNTYIVKQYNDGGWSCSCPHYAYRLSGTNQICKHIDKIKREHSIKD